MVVQVSIVRGLFGCIVVDLLSQPLLTLKYTQAGLSLALIVRQTPMGCHEGFWCFRAQPTNDKTSWNRMVEANSLQNNLHPQLGLSSAKRLKNI